MNTEQQRRLAEISRIVNGSRCEQGRYYDLHGSLLGAGPEYRGDAGELLKEVLSIVKGQEADKFDGPCVNCGHNNYDAERHECAQRWMEGRMSVVCGCPCAKHNSLDAAVNRMRSLCVEKVKSMRDAWQVEVEAKRDPDNPLEYHGSYGLAVGAVDACDDIIKELESLSIQEQK